MVLVNLVIGILAAVMLAAVHVDAGDDSEVAAEQPAAPAAAADTSEDRPGEAEPVEVEPAQADDADKEDKQPQHDPKVVALLRRIEAKAKETKTVKAPLDHWRIESLTGDKQLRKGELAYSSQAPAKFAIHFHSLIYDRKLVKQDRFYIFDGVWLAEKFVKERTFVRRQVVPLNAPEDQRNPLELGEGPFPLPLNFDHEKLLERFEVEIIEPFEGRDPERMREKERKHLEGTVRLRLTPREKKGTGITRFDFWYDAKTLLPRRLQTVNTDGNKEILDLHIGEDVDENVNVELEESTFDTGPPKGGGWDIKITPLRKPAKENGEEGA